MIPHGNKHGLSSMCPSTKYIGTDFDKVELVADNMDMLKELSTNGLNNKQNKSLSFAIGGTLQVGDDHVPVYYEDSLGNLYEYIWMGTLPKQVPPNSTPETSGGISKTTWSLIASNNIAAGGIPDAPSTGEAYARYNTTWVTLNTNYVEPTINRMYWTPALQSDLDNKVGSLTTSSGTGHDLLVALSSNAFKLKKLNQGSNVVLTEDGDTITISATSSGGTSGEVNTASNIGNGTGIFAQKSGVDLQFKTLKTLGAATITSDANSVTIDVTAAGGGDMLASVYDPQNIADDAFARANHTGAQAISTVTGLQASLDNKLSKSTYDPHNIASDAFARANHTGTQAISTVAGLQASLDDKLVNVTNGATTGEALASRPVSSADVFVKRLKAGTNVTLSSDDNSVTINTSGGSGEVNTASNIGTGAGIYSTKEGSELKFKTLSNAGNTFFTFESGVNEITVNINGLTTAFNNKVDKDGTKVLSTNDFTDSLKTKLDGIQSGAQVNPTTFPWSGITGKPSTLSGYGITDALSTTNSGSQTISGSLILNGAIRVNDLVSYTASIGYIRYSTSSNAMQVDSSGVSFSIAPKPLTDGGVTCGTSGRRFSTIYAQTSTISTSDARLKTEVRSITEAEKATALEIKQSLGFYKWLSSITLKGEEEARLHCGTTVQKVMECFENNGLDPFKYGIVCYDATDTIVNSDGEEEVIQIDLYSLRESQLVLFLIASL